MTEDRQQAARYQINVADVQDAVQRLQIPMDHGSFMGILEGFGDLPGVDYGYVHGLRAGKRLAFHKLHRQCAHPTRFPDAI